MEDYLKERKDAVISKMAGLPLTASQELGRRSQKRPRAIGLPKLKKLGLDY